MDPVYSSAMAERSELLGAEITELCGYLNAGTYRLLEMIRVFDQECLWALMGINSCAHWLNFACGIGMNAAREKVRVANALGGLEKISAAFGRGELSYSKVRAMTRVATPDNEDYLLEIARYGTAAHMESLVSKYRRSKRLQDTASARSQHEERELTYRYDFNDGDGSMVIHARLPAEVGALVIKALDKAVERRWKEQDGVEDKDDDDVSAETLVDGSGERSELEDGPEISAETSRRIACEASRVMLIEDGDGEPLNIGRKARAIPPPMRRALKARDNGCRFPGCTNKRFVDGHHIEHWAEGGETSLANLIELCRKHHRLVHEGGFACEKNPDGRVVFSNPQGQVIPSNGYPLPRLKDGESIDWFRDEFRELGIDSGTVVNQWDGQPMDHCLAVGHLYSIEERAAELAAGIGVGSAAITNQE